MSWCPKAEWCVESLENLGFLVILEFQPLNIILLGVGIPKLVLPVISILSLLLNLIDSSDFHQAKNVIMHLYAFLSKISKYMNK